MMFEIVLSEKGWLGKCLIYLRQQIILKWKRKFKNHEEISLTKKYKFKTVHKIIFEFQKYIF